MNREIELAAALDRLLDRLAAACEQAGRDVSEVALLPVTKYFPASDVEILYRLGRRDFAESREQEASAKVSAFRAGECSVTAGGDSALTSGEAALWHMIGRLQRNKARAVAAWAYAIHSVDTARLIDALSHAVTDEFEAGRRSEPLHVLLQISLDGDPDRGGVLAADLPGLAGHVADAANLELRGVMAIPPLGADRGAAFAKLAGLHQRLLREHPGALELSAGMSGDLELAVEHGSTCVRVGTALLGPRPIISP